MAMEKDIDPAQLAEVRKRAAEMHDKYVKQAASGKPLSSREDALALLHGWVQSESLHKHMLSVEAAMRAYARKFSADENLWGLTGLLHDFDYEKNATIDTHVFAGIPILAERGYPPEMLDAIIGHADYYELPRQTPLAKTLFAVDELCGFLTAMAYVRPNKSLAGLEFSSFNKKFKDKRFASSVSREDIQKGASELGVELREHVLFVAAALEAISGA
ncbi:MAG TPA: HDIG domain-containing protein [Planctomycetota bacterium]|nr:HDIG domain-containing protein [Planctomycetota bacterium]